VRFRKGGDEVNLPQISGVRPVLTEDPPGADKRWYWREKRLFDVIFSVIALVVLSPVMLVTALAILLDDHSAGAIYVQKRCGRGGKEFNLYKFRSMVGDADQHLDELMHKNEMDGPVFKIKDDPRVTRVGRLIRKVSIDELPQLVNVLRGDMSIVGPRPPLPREVALYDEYHWQRLAVTPGLTCLWQITPQRNDLTFDEWVRLDVCYVQNRSLLLDFKLIVKTVGVIFTAQGR